jgi:hypothetical protein
MFKKIITIWVIVLKETTMIKTLLTAAAIALTVTSAQAGSNRISGTGTLMDVDVRKNADWPLAVIWDTDGKYACTIDRGGAGHDPLRPCNVGEKCRVVGTFQKIGETYSIKIIDHLEYKE